MKPKFVASLVALSAVFVLAASPAAFSAAHAAPPVYRIVQPEVAHGLAVRGEAINNNGTVAGRVATRLYSNHRLFVWKPDRGAKIFADTNHGDFLSVTGLNDQDQAVGTISHIGPAGVTITDLFLLSRGKLRFGRDVVQIVDWIDPGNINEAGTVPLLAHRPDVTSVNFLWTVGQAPELHPFDNRRTRWINNAGVQVGSTYAYSAFRLDVDGVMTELVPLKTTRRAVTVANAINEAGQIVGSSWAQSDRVTSTHAVLWQPSGDVVDIGLLPGELLCEAKRINERSEVVGSCNHGEGLYPGFYWNAEVGMLKLRDLIDPTDPLLPAIASLEAVDINDHGTVLANAKTAEGLAYTLVLQPQ